ncbi:FHA domain-containing protein [Jatrophihabitans sp.]|uniref:FHA domain-containing protein n=1 Tax=Jatrophihabitans sp. TaxID=1932789 RepID=UPI0030C750D8|nr:hypothetical protein [Jatrophihabitans sp.]
MDAVPVHVGVESGPGLVARFGSSAVVLATAGPNQESFTPALLALLDSPLAPSSVEAAWTIAGLLVKNRDTAPAFAVALPTETGYLLFLHGNVRAEVTRSDESYSLDARGALTWIDHVAAQPIIRIALSLTDSGAINADPISDLRGGTVGGSGLVLTPGGSSALTAAILAAPAAPAIEAPAAPAAEEPVAEEPRTEEAPAEELPAEELPVAEAPADEELPVAEAPSDEAPSDEAPTEVVRAEPAPVEDALSGPLPEELAGDLAESTPFFPPLEPPSVDVPVDPTPTFIESSPWDNHEPAPEAEAETEHHGIDLDKQSTEPAIGMLVADDGVRTPLDRAYAFGREPQSDEAVSRGDVTPIVVNDPDALVSRLQFYIWVDGDLVVVRDNASANGTFVAAPGAPDWTRLGPDPVILPVGWSLRVGRRVYTHVSGT